MAGHEVTLTRHGEPVAVVIRPDRLRTRRGDDVFAAAARLREMLDRASESPLPEPSVSEDYAEAWVAEVRAGRQH